MPSVHFDPTPRDGAPGGVVMTGWLLMPFNRGYTPVKILRVREDGVAVVAFGGDSFAVPTRPESFGPFDDRPAAVAFAKERALPRARFNGSKLS